jgi:hypothetical protein
MTSSLVENTELYRFNLNSCGVHVADSQVVWQNNYFFLGLAYWGAKLFNANAAIPF